MEKRKYFQIKMKPTIHAQAKVRAKQLGVSIGEFFENVISSTELRLKKAYKTAEIQEGLVDDLMMRVIIRDDLSLDKEELKNELMEVRKSTTTTTSTTTSIPEEDFKTTITV